jgi:ABC-type Fe3+ transport system substrate-binding protein
MLYRNAPHPDAAKTFLNWFYTKEGQSAYCRNFLCISVRKDVAQDYLPPEVRYIEGTPFMRSKAEDLEDKRARELGDLAIEIFVKRKK